MLRRRPLLGALGLFAACAPSAPAKVAVAPAPPPVVAVPSGPLPLPLQRPSAAVTRHWPFGEKVDVGLYVDLVGLRHTGLARSLGPELLAAFDDRGAASGCALEVAPAIKTVVFGQAGPGSLAILEVEGLTALPASCIAAAQLTPTALTSASATSEPPEAWAVGLPGWDGVVFVRANDAWWIGDRVSVASALAPKDPIFPVSLGLGEGQYFSWKARFDEARRARATVTVTESGVRAEVLADVAEADAEAGVSEFERLRAPSVLAGATGLGGADATAIARLVGATQANRDGGHVALTMDLEEPPVDQARDVGAAGRVLIGQFKRGIARAKFAEASVTVLAIAKAYVAFWEHGDPTHPAKGPRKLVALPAVPSKVPRGTRYASTPADWKAWLPIGFQLADPQAFQYEVRLTKAGAEVLARGDLNGDGKTSRFRLGLTLEGLGAARTLVMAPQVEETDPGE